jgi:hypothetical protein
VAEGFAIAEGFVDISSRVDEAKNKRNAEKAGDDAGDSFLKRMGTKLLSGLAQSVLPAVGAALNAGLAAAPAVAATAVAVYQVAGAALAAAPAVLALGVSFKLTTLAVKALLPAVQKSLSPISDEFKRVTEQASRLATRGVRPLAQEFVKVNFPAVRTFMDQIARATNSVVTSTLRWLNTIPGQQAVANILGATGAAAQRLVPHLNRAVQSFLAMLGRISGISLAAGEQGLSGVLEKLADWMDRVTGESVQAGLDKLISTWQAVSGAVSTVVRWVGIAVGIYRQYRTEINLIADALGILAIVFGGPVTAIIALVGMVIRHFDLIRTVYQNLMASFQNSTQGPAFLNNLKAAADVVVPALVNGFHQIWAAIGPVLSQIWTKITTQLIPAFGEFVAAMAPVVAFFIERLVPIVTVAMKTILTTISGVIDIITGIFKVFTGILRGDWSKVWEGIKQILRGAVTVLVGILKGLVGLARAGLSNLGATLAGVFRGAVRLAIDALGTIVGKVRSTLGKVKGAVTGALSGAGSWLKDAGRRIISGLIDGIRGMLGSLRSELGKVTNLIPDWKGPADKDAKLLTPAGQKIMEGLLRGIVSRRAALRSLLTSVTHDATSVVTSAARAAAFANNPQAQARNAAQVALANTPAAQARAAAQTALARSSAAALARQAALKAKQAAATPTFTPEGAATTTSNGLTVSELHVHIEGILDPKNPSAARELARTLYELLKDYERSFA